MSPRIVSRTIAIGAAVLALVALPACSSDDDGGDTATDTATETASDTGGEAEVAVTLQEFAVSADPSSVPAGSVTFDVTNDGPDDVHVSLTPEAAEVTSERLSEEAVWARGQRRLSNLTHRPKA